LLYFGLKFHDLDEYTGNRVWPFLRKFYFNQSVTYQFSDKSVCNANQKLVFVVVGNLTNMSLISAFGFHGNIFQNLDLIYLLPRILFKIPILRDILLWSGAGVNTTDNIARLLYNGKSVAFAPSGMNNMISYTDPKEKEKIQMPSEDTLKFIYDNKLLIVPVLIGNETKRYWIWRGKYVHMIQTYFASTRLKWPFPVLYGVKIFGSTPPPKVTVTIGAIIDCSRLDSITKIQENFKTQIEGFLNVTGDDREFI